jgi:hypothetical protein
MSSFSVCIAGVARLHGDLTCGVDVEVVCPQEVALAHLILGDGQGLWTGVQVGYNRETCL